MPAERLALSAVEVSRSQSFKKQIPCFSFCVLCLGLDFDSRYSILLFDFNFFVTHFYLLETMDKTGGFF